MKNSEINVNQQDEKGFSYLHCAVQAKSKTLIKVLLEMGADINIQDIFGKTPLLLALGTYDFKDDSIIRFLLEMGANTNIPTRNGITPKDIAKRKGVPEDIIQKL